MLPKMSEYIKTCKDKGGGENENNKLMSLHIDDDKWISHWKNIKPFGLRLKTSKILNWMLYKSMMIDI